MNAPFVETNTAAPAFRDMQPQPDWTVFREGSVLAFYQNVPFPCHCIKCAAPATRTVRTKLQWHNPWMYLLIVFPGLLIYAIAATIVSERAVVDVPLCERHHTLRFRSLAAAWALFAFSLIFPLVALNYSRADDALGAGVCAIPCVGIFAALLVAIVGGRLLTPTYIDKQVVRVRGAGNAFLARCPDASAQPRNVLPY